MSDAIFSSRFAAKPAHVSEAGALPAGFRLGGAAAGVKQAGGDDLDLGLLVSDAPGTVSAARFCDSGVLAAPVVVTREQCDLHAIRAVIANSGNANAATGEAGMSEAVRMQEAAASALSLSPREVAVASTGVIGVLLPGERIAAAVPALAQRLSEHGLPEFSDAIKTTDALEKSATLTVELPSGSVRLSAAAKGAGMISPRFATMLCFVQTDAALTPAGADALLGAAVRRSFDRISVDGQLSTNDTVILMASGRSGIHVEPGSEDEERFAEALDALLLALALRIAADGEGARRIARVQVRAGGEETAERVARAVANSPLVKAALFGGDPNWGRIAQSIGAALPGTAPLRFEIAIEGIAVARDGAGIEHDSSDLSYDYVKINAEYTT
jgi:glutamate N-acetyltransferase/amino-acid N-acetyltransferase